MEHFLGIGLSSFASLLPVIDPIAGVPIFIVFTTTATQAFRDQLARRIALYTILVLVLALLIGGSFLHFFGVSLDVIRIAGGIVISHAAWQMMNADPKLSAEENEEVTHQQEESSDITFVPMTIPLYAGPGSIAVTLGLAAQAGTNISLERGFDLLAVGVAIALNGLIIYLCLKLSDFFLLWLGETGIKAFSRILGLFILAVGVQLILNGVADWLQVLGLVSDEGLKKAFITPLM